MSIVNQLPIAAMLGVPFADYLNVSVPVDVGAEVKEQVISIIASLGPYSETMPGVYALFNSQLKPTGAVFKVRGRGKVLVISASGMALEALRVNRAYADYLRVLASYPHRVTMLHATQDYFVLSPSEVILAVKDAAFAGELALTRKRLLPSQVGVLLSPGSDGAETGTVYLGNRANADVWAKVYDKRHERLAKGYADPGPIVRVEVAVQSDVGATLRDAWCPHDLFFYHASKTIVEAPQGFAGWAPSGEGFVLGERREVLPDERLHRLFENSADVRVLVNLAVDLYGDRGWRVLARLFFKVFRSVAAARQV